MSASLLATKLYIPPARANAVARPHLTKKLLSGVDRPGSFTLLSGPAGFGKMEKPCFYEIRIEGHLTERWSAWFEGLAIHNDQHGETTSFVFSIFLLIFTSEKLSKIHNHFLIYANDKV